MKLQIRGSLPVILIFLLGLGLIQVGCENADFTKPKAKFAFPLGHDTAVLYLDSVFYEIDCGIHQFDDARCQAFESDDCRIFCNFSHMSGLILELYTSTNQTKFDSLVQASMLEKLNYQYPESTLEKFTAIKKRHGMESGNAMVYKIADIKYLRFGGFSLDKRILLSIQIELKTNKYTPEQVLFSFLDNLSFHRRSGQ